MLFNVLRSTGLGSNNLKSGEPRARYRQTEAEHLEALDPKNTEEWRMAQLAPNPLVKAQLEAMAVNRAKMREQELPEYWDDELPRRQVSQSSSWVGDVQYDPYTQNMTVMLGKKSKSYPGVTPTRVAEILASSSIGKEIEKMNK